MGFSDTQDTLLVVVGAGASHACMPGVVLDAHEIGAAGLERLPFAQVRPPLTQDLVRSGPLVNTIVARYPACRPVVDELQMALSSTSESGDAISLELILRQYQDRAATDNTIHRHVMGFRFFLRDLLWACTKYMLSVDLKGGLTRYDTLVRRTYQWARDRNSYTCFVDFNFDLLLEEACTSQWGFAAWQPDAYVDHEVASILKPHGSVKWTWDMPERKSVGVGLEGARQTIDNAALRVDQNALGMGANDPFDLNMTIGDFTPLKVPAIAIPVDGKTEFVWPREQADLLTSLQGRVGRVLMIGWRAAEAHFLALLRPVVRAGARVLVVTGGSAATQDFGTVNSAIRTAIDYPEDVRPSYSGFGGLDQNTADFDWLLGPKDWPR